jgi:uncharacterized protein YuzE
VLYLLRADTTHASDGALTPEGHGIRYDEHGQVTGITIINARRILERSLTHGTQTSTSHPTPTPEIEDEQEIAGGQQLDVVAQRSAFSKVRLLLWRMASKMRQPTLALRSKGPGDPSLEPQTQRLWPLALGPYFFWRLLLHPNRRPFSDMGALPTPNANGHTGVY